KQQVFLAPRTPLEKLLAAGWAEILQVKQVGVHDNFFALGGDSLLLASVLAHIYEAVHVEMDPSRFFEAPTIAETARYLDTFDNDEQTAQASLIVRVQRGGPLPASVAQEHLWKAQQLLRGKPIFNIFCPLRLTSACDVAMLQSSIN